MEDKMLERIARQLESVEARYEELSVQITLPEVINDAPRFQKLMREHSDIADLAEFARGHAVVLFELLGKIRHIVKANCLGNG